MVLQCTACAYLIFNMRSLTHTHSVQFSLIFNYPRRMLNCKHVQLVEFGSMYDTLIGVDI